MDGALPASGIDSKLVRVERNQKVFCADVPPLLRNLDAPDWNNAHYLKQTFITPPLDDKGSAKNRRWLSHIAY